VVEAAVRAVKRAAELIDMRTHRGEHPRLGATDVLPFVPFHGVTMEDCVRLAQEAGKRIASELSYDDFVEWGTFARNASLAGERGGVFRDSDQAQESAKQYRALEAEAFKACGLQVPK
jgi:glutamate formiminotransferase